MSTPTTTDLSDAPSMGWTAAQLHQHEVALLRELAKDERLSSRFGGDLALTILALVLVISAYKRDNDRRPVHPTVEENAILAGFRQAIVALTGASPDVYVQPGWVAVAAAIAAVIAGETTPALEYARSALILGGCMNPNARTEPAPEGAQPEGYPDASNPNALVFALAVEESPFVLAAYLLGWANRHDDLMTEEPGSWQGNDILQAFDPVFYALHEGRYTEWPGGSSLTPQQRDELGDEIDESQERLWEKVYMQAYNGGRIILTPPAAPAGEELEEPTPATHEAMVAALDNLGYEAVITVERNGHRLLLVEGAYPMSLEEAGSLLRVTRQRGETLEIGDYADHYGRGRGGDDERLGWSYTFEAALTESDTDSK